MKPRNTSCKTEPLGTATGSPGGWPAQACPGVAALPPWRGCVAVVFSRWNIAAAVAATFLWMGADHENQLYDALVAHATRPDMGEEEKLLALMRTTHNIVHHRGPIFAGRQAGLRCAETVLLRSGDTELLQADGACGSCAHIFAEACHRAGIRARICQLGDGGDSTQHVITEALLGDQWVIVDPRFEQVFRRPDGQLAGCREVGADWAYYRCQAPGYLENNYDFSNVRYTNWSRVPVLLPLVKAALDGVAGHERADTVSLRSYCLNTYSVYLSLLLALTAALNVVLAVTRWRRRGRGPARPAAGYRGRPSMESPQPDPWTVKPPCREAVVTLGSGLRNDAAPLRNGTTGSHG